MSKFKLFKPWTWFESKNKEEEKDEETYMGQEENIGYSYSNSFKPYESVTETTTEKWLGYANIIFTGTSIVVIFKDGSVVMKNGVDASMVTRVKDAMSEHEIRELLASPKEVEPVKEKAKVIEIETPTERKIISANLGILKASGEFLVKGEQVFLRDVDLELPAVVAGSFIELLERINRLEGSLDFDEVDDEDVDDTLESIDGLRAQYEALKMFWYWTALNPIESARKDLFSFIRKNDITITSNGLLLMYRRVVSVTDSKVDKKLVEFISSSYAKVKKWKKSPKNYEIFDDNGYVLVDSYKQNHGYNNHKGNLHDLYQNLDTLQSEKTYTDSHSGRKNIKIGAIYEEDETLIDLDNSRDCSTGLHVGSRHFGFDGFGDVGVVCLVNPMYVRSVPVSDAHKMRVSQMFIVAEMPLEEYEQYVEDQLVADYSDEYCQTTVEELQKAVKDKIYEGLSCQGNIPVVKLGDLEKIISHIEDRVSEVY